MGVNGLIWPWNKQRFAFIFALYSVSHLVFANCLQLVPAENEEEKYTYDRD